MSNMPPFGHCFMMLGNTQNNDIKSIKTRPEIDLETRIRALRSRQTKIYNMVDLTELLSHYLAEKTHDAPFWAPCPLLEHAPFCTLPYQFSDNFDFFRFK